MKKQIGIWMDTDKAVLIDLSSGQEELTTIESKIETRTRYSGEKKPHGKMASMLVNLASKATNRHNQQKHAYFANILQHLNDASDLYVFGPSLTKVDFEKELKKRHQTSTMHVDIENKGKLTPRQMVAQVKTHFNQ